MRTTRTRSSILTTAGLALLLTGPALSTSGEEIQPPESILTAARDHLEQTARAQHSGRVEVQMGHLDPRLRLTRCDQPLEVFQPSGARTGGRTSVGVRCADATGWTIYVSANVDIFNKALVTTRALPRGAELAPGDVRPVETSLAGLGAGYLQDPAEIEGLATRRPLQAGTVLTPAMLKAPQIVRRGDRVTLVGGEGPIQVEMQGEAVNDAARGERVRVRALNSQRIVEGWVVSASVVKVTL
jgi:flagella basal body P-ring formation protein FlgA